MVAGSSGGQGGDDEDGPGPVELRPGSEEEVAAALRLASESGWSIVPSGSGTWLGAGDPVDGPDAVLSVSSLDRIVQYEPADLTLTVGAGITLPGLASLTARQRQWLPLDPPGAPRGTLGATLATGSAGGLATLYGAPRDLCLGMRLVTGDGRVLSLGGRVVKNVAGFDMVKLLVGSWGTLGVITEATMRLYPLPETEVLLVARASRLEELADAARRVASAGVLAAAVEMIERPQGDGGSGREALLRVRVHGLEERVRREAADLEERMRPLSVERHERAGARAGGAGQEDDPLSAELARLEEGAELVMRMLLPPTELQELVEIARRLGRMPGSHDLLVGTPLRIAVDASRSGLTVAVPSLREDPSWTAAWTSQLRELRRALEMREGSLTMLLGPRSLVAGVGAWGGPAAAGRVMSSLKAQFDPAGILSPGRFAFP